MEDVHSITTPTTFSNLLNVTLNYWIISLCCLSSIIWAFSVSASLTLQIVEPYLLILKVFKMMQHFRMLPHLENDEVPPPLTQHSHHDAA